MVVSVSRPVRDDGGPSGSLLRSWVGNAAGRLAGLAARILARASEATPDVAAAWGPALSTLRRGTLDVEAAAGQLGATSPGDSEFDTMAANATGQLARLAAVYAGLDPDRQAARRAEVGLGLQRVETTLAGILRGLSDERPSA